jgi:hypothetical protein
MITKVECTKTATAATFTPGKWACLEWNVDANQGVMHFWLDGVAQTEVDVAVVRSRTRFALAPALLAR